MQKIWQIKPENKPLQAHIATTLNISPIIAQLLINRDITTPEQAGQFLQPKLADLHDPFLFKDMHLAVNRIKQAINNKEHIAIYGDYDADGITSTAALYRFLTSIGGQVSYYIPHRVDEGYGINKSALDLLIKQHANLLISVDCGITSIAEIKHLNQHNINTLILDHHKPLNSLPAAFAIINPLVSDEPYPDKNLAGVGVVFKLICAMSKSINEEYLDLVALGTVCDVEPLIGENRILVKYGIEKMRKTPCLGLKALIDTARLKPNSITAYHLGYILGPRINASGRISLPDSALKLLLTDSWQEALDISKGLESKNRLRQRTEEQILKDALIKMDQEINFKHHRVVVLHDEKWHTGVIGIVASRLVDRFYRPTLLFGSDNGMARGSGRSIRNFHLFDAICQCQDLIEHFGGHEHAVGVNIKKHNLEKFKQKINEHAHNILTPDDLMPYIDVDMEIPLEVLSEKFITELDNLGPFGSANPRPIFATRNLKFKGKPVKIGKDGFKIWVTDNNKTCEAIVFKSNDIACEDCIDCATDLVYAPAINNWQGVTTIQLQLKDLKINSPCATY